MILRRPVVVRTRPGLVGTMARTAVVAGTATAVSNSISNRMNRSGTPSEQYMQPAPQPQVSAPDVSAQLRELNELRKEGAISAEEYEVAKRQIMRT
jgi:hypothetical protein